MNKKRQVAIEKVKSWINVLTRDSFGMEKLKAYNGDQLDNMTLKEINMLLDFIVATYHHAFQLGCKPKPQRVVLDYTTDDCPF